MLLRLFRGLLALLRKNRVENCECLVQYLDWSFRVCDCVVYYWIFEALGCSMPWYGG